MRHACRWGHLSATFSLPSNLTMSSTTDQGKIGIVDFGSFSKGNETERQTIGKAIIESFRRCGFVYLINHPLPSDKITDMFAWVGVLLSDISSKVELKMKT